LTFDIGVERGGVEGIGVEAIEAVCGGVEGIGVEGIVVAAEMEEAEGIVFAVSVEQQAPSERAQIFVTLLEVLGLDASVPQVFVSAMSHAESVVLAAQ